MKKCLVCDTAFVPNRAESKFCSRKCFYQSRLGSTRPDLRKRVVKTCPVCNSRFEWGGRAGHNTFCSRECAARARYRRGTKANELTATQAAYMAGLVDGEGTIMLYRRRQYAALRLVVSNTNAAVLDWCATTMGVGDVQWKHRGNEKHRAAGMWSANSDAAEGIIAQMLPYLVIKRQQAELALDFRQRIRNPADKADPTWQEQYRLRMCAMNARGPKVTEADTTTD